MNRQYGVLPFAPLGDVLERVFPEISADAHTYSPAGDLQRASEVLGMARETLARYKAGNLLSIDVADRCAIRLGLHPLVIWWDFDEVCDRVDREMAAQREASAERRRERCREQRQRRADAA